MTLIERFDAYLQGVNLIPLHFVLCFAGALMCVAVMQLATAHGDLMQESKAGIWIRRFSLSLLGLSLCWACSFSATKGWQPWPPDVLVIFALDVVLALRGLQIIHRCAQYKALFEMQRRRARLIAGAAHWPSARHQ